MPFGLQPIHLIAVAVVALLIFGPAKLPELGRSFGKALTEFRRGAKEMTGSFMEEISQPIDGDPGQVPAQTPNSQPAAVTPAAGQTTGFNAAKPVYFEDIRPAGNESETAAVETPVSEGNFCIHCGKSNPTGAVFCNSCGSKIAA